MWGSKLEQRKARAKWLEERGLDEYNVLNNENGDYVIEEHEMGSPGDDYQVEYRRCYLPDELQDASF